MSSYKALIVGTGPSGLVTLRHFLKAGIEPVLALEKRHDVGGIWLYEESPQPHSSAYASLHTITSRYQSGLEDFPMPQDYPDYPSHKLVYRYFRAYAEKFDLLRHIQFGQEVVSAVPIEKGWEVHTATGKVFTCEYLIVASGHHWEPLMPSFEGTFEGEVLHAHYYRKPDIVQDLRVLVVGGGNSAADIAVDVCRRASFTSISMRRGYHVIPKFTLWGMPSDWVYHQMRWLPHPLRNWIVHLSLQLFIGDMRKYGLQKPTMPLFSIHPVVNTELLYNIRHGRILPRPNIQRFKGNTVIFDNGHEEPYDLIIYATGYKIRFPFLPPELEPTEEKVFEVYERIFSLKNPRLIFIGFIQPNGCLWNLSEKQAKWAAKYILGQYQLPADVFQKTEAEKQHHWQKYLHTPRHLLEVDWHAYYRKLQKAAG
ncbi:MAG: flavin-containing monooxygenase [Bacteroidia bacterium]